MKEDVCSMKQNGADGIVMGILLSDGSIDKRRCREIIDISRPLPVTFHRAFDMSACLQSSLEDVIELGCERILTSGGKQNAHDGTPEIRQLIEQAQNRVIIVPGGGISEQNVAEIR